MPASLKAAASPKPIVFIGSSTEGLTVARAVKQALAPCANAVVWDEVIGTPTGNVFDDLLEQVDRSDFGVFIFLPDDVVVTRGKKQPAVRQNVLFEFALYVGRLGRKRAVMLVPRTDPPLHPCSDLWGVTPINYDPTVNDLQEALADACTHVRDAIAAGTSEKGGRTQKNGVEAFGDMNAAFGAVKDRLDGGGLAVTRAEFIQHSSERASKLVEALAARHVDLTVYVQHELTTDVICADLKLRVLRQLTLYPATLENLRYAGEFEYHYYRPPAAFNGFRLWNGKKPVLLALGWYTYLSHEASTPLTHMKVDGSENPSFVMEPSHPRFLDFNRFVGGLINWHKRQSEGPRLHMKDGVCTRNDGWGPLAPADHPDPAPPPKNRPSSSGAGPNRGRRK